MDNGGNIFHGCENSDHPLIYDDANINFISHCGGSAASPNSNPTTGCVSSSSTDHRKNISSSLMCPSASSTSNTYLIDVPIHDKNQVSKLYIFYIILIYFIKYNEHNSLINVELG